MAEFGRPIAPQQTPQVFVQVALLPDGNVELRSNLDDGGHNWCAVLHLLGEAVKLAASKASEHVRPAQPLVEVPQIILPPGVGA